jgi:hypothetical protein
MMAFPAMFSELYDALRRKVGAERPAWVVPEPFWWHRWRAASRPRATIEDTRFRRIDGKFDALSHTLDQRFDALSQRFDGLHQPYGGLSRVMDQRFGAFGHEMGQRFDALSRMIDDRFAMVDRQFAVRDARFARLETKTAEIADMDVCLKRLETKTATEFRYLRWGLGIVIALVLGLVPKAILDWLMPLLA